MVWNYGENYYIPSEENITTKRNHLRSKGGQRAVNNEPSVQGGTTHDMQHTYYFITYIKSFLNNLIEIQSYPAENFLHSCIKVKPFMLIPICLVSFLVDIEKVRRETCTTLKFG